MSLDSSMSLNIPSSLLVNAAPHSVGVKNHNTILSLQMTCGPQRLGFKCFLCYFNLRGRSRSFEIKLN